MAGILGRSFPIRPHLARPLVGAAAGPAIVTTAYLVTEQAQRRAHIRRTTPKPHLAPMTLAGPREDPFLLGLFIGQAIPRALTARALTAPRPHLAGPVLTTTTAGQIPLVLQTIAARQARARPLTRRTVPRPHTARSLVGPATTAAIVTTPYLVTDSAQRRALTGRAVPPRPHLAPPVLTTPTSGVLPLVLQTTVQRQAHNRPTEFRRTVPKPHLPPFLPPPEEETFITGIFTFQAINRALIGRNAPAPHLPTSLGDPGAPLPTPFLLQIMVTRQARNRALIGRDIPPPHLAQPVLVTPPVQPATITMQAALWRPLRRRTVPKPHLAPRTLTQPTAIPPILLQTIVAKQAMRRPLTRRTVPKPHLAKPNVGQYVPPAPPANRWLMHRRRSIRGTNRPLRSRRQ